MAVVVVPRNAVIAEIVISYSDVRVLTGSITRNTDMSRNTPPIVSVCSVVIFLSPLLSSTKIWKGGKPCLLATLMQSTLPSKMVCGCDLILIAIVVAQLHLKQLQARLSNSAPLSLA